MPRVCTLICGTTFLWVMASPSVAGSRPLTKQPCPHFVDNEFLRTNCSAAVDTRDLATFYKCSFHHHNHTVDNIVKIAANTGKCHLYPMLNLTQSGCVTNIQCRTPNSFCAPEMAHDYREGPRCKCRAPLYTPNGDGQGAACVMELTTQHQVTTTTTEVTPDAPVAETVRWSPLATALAMGATGGIIGVAIIACVAFCVLKWRNQAHTQLQAHRNCTHAQDAHAIGVQLQEPSAAQAPGNGSIDEGRPFMPDQRRPSWPVEPDESKIRN